MKREKVERLEDRIGLVIRDMQRKTSLIQEVQNGEMVVSPEMLLNCISGWIRDLKIVSWELEDEKRVV